MPEQTEAVGADPLEVQSFSFQPQASGVVDLILDGSWSVADPSSCPRLLLVHRTEGRVNALTPLPVWGEGATRPAAGGQLWSMRWRCGEHLLAAGTFELWIEDSLVLELAPPQALGVQGDGAPPSVVQSVRSRNPSDLLAPVLDGGESTKPRDAEQRSRMIEALSAQNRDLRARVSDLEEALAQAQDAVSVALQLQELIGVEASAAQARANLEDARSALREVLFKPAGDASVAELWRIAEHERAARDELAARVSEVEAARADALDALPKPS